MADPVALAVIEDALASPVRVMDTDVVPIAVIVMGVPALKCFPRRPASGAHARRRDFSCG